MASPKVLIVDDSQVMRLTVRKSFEKQGFTVIEADNGEQAIETLTEHPDVALIVSDFNMPVMNGLVMVETMRKNEQFAKIPVIMLTAQSNRELIDRGKRAGIAGWVIKPLKPGVIETLAQKYGASS